MEGSGTSKFDPEEHHNNTYEAFCDFVKKFTYEYEAIAKEPPKDLNAQEKAEWILQNKRKMFLGKFASTNLINDFEEVTTEEERSTIDYSATIAKLKAHYKGTWNTTIANFEFRKLKQMSDESFDAFHGRVKREAANCDFKCQHDDCTVWKTLCRDQILYGYTNQEIQKNGLKNQWGLDDLVKNGRALESATWGAQKIKAEPEERGVSRVTPGKYSKKYKLVKAEKDKPNHRISHEKSDKAHKRCSTCSLPACRA